MTAAAQAELAAWLACDRRNRGAFLRAQAALVRMETAVRDGAGMLASGNDAEFAPAARSGRQRRLARWAMAAGVAATALLGLAMLLPSWREEAALARQEMPLRDGSVVALDPGAEVRVELDDRVRRVVLLSGRATFRVAADATRPFVVRSGEVYAQATGTVYSVGRVGGSGATVEVAEGSVLVWAGEARSQAVALRAGGRLTLDPGAAAIDAARPVPGDARISLDDVPIAEAVARFNRVNRTQIAVADPAIGRLRIVGLFRADDPEGFARAAAAMAGADVVQHGDTLVIGAR